MFILDGHNRFEILTELNIEPKFEADSRAFKCKEEAMIWVIDNQIIRRNVPQYVRSALALKKKDIMKKIGKGIMGQSAEKRKEPEWLGKPLVGSGKYLPPYTKIRGKKLKPQDAKDETVDASSDLNKHEDDEQPYDTWKELANTAGVSVGTLHKVAKIEKCGSEDLKQRAMSGKISIDAAYKEMRGLNSDDAPLSKIDELIEKIVDIADKNLELSEKIFSHNDEMNDDQREEVFEAVDVNKDAIANFNKCVHGPEECIPNIPTFGEPNGQDYA